MIETKTRISYRKWLPVCKMTGSGYKMNGSVGLKNRDLIGDVLFLYIVLF